MRRFTLLSLALAAAASALVFAACFSAPAEAQCTTDADCPAGQHCEGTACAANDGGAGGGGGGGATGGGDGGGATGGGSGGGATGGGAGGGLDGGACGCQSALGCQPGDSPIACGTGGAMCQTCGLGEQCVNGACVMAPCGPMTCTGCCTNNFCVTPSQQNRFGCGSNGAACMGCPMGQTCTNGQCVTPPPCDATTCPTGCCQNGQCQPGNTGRACGSGGQACQPCGFGNSCTAGVCVQPDGGAVMPVPVGSPCTTGMQCQPPQGALCVQESVFGQATGFTGGYCTAQCGPMQPCSSGVCVTESIFGFSGSTCRATCAAPGMGQSTCRTGYVCAALAGSTTGYCKPNCNNPQQMPCPMGQTCQATGYCQ